MNETFRKCYFVLNNNNKLHESGNYLAESFSGINFVLILTCEFIHKID